jgi:chemotaxis signal transduction protein
MTDTAPVIDLPLPALEAVERACVFAWGDHQYGFPVAEVREVAVVPALTPTPRMPAQVLGITNLRGVVIPVLDPGLLLGERTGPAPGPLVTVVLKDGREDVAVAVDRVLGLRAIEQFQPGEPVPGCSEGRFLSDGTPVVLLSGRAMLTTLRPVPTAP